MSGDRALDPVIVWIGRLLARDGYGSAARRHVAGLRDVGAPIVAVDLPTRQVVGAVAAGTVHVRRHGAELRLTATNPDRALVVVVHDRPDRYPHVAAAGRARVVGYSYAETEGLPPGWPGLMTSMDRVWTSSAFNAASFASSGVPAWMIDVVGLPVGRLALAVAPTRSQLRGRWTASTVFLTIVAAPLGRRDLALLLEAYGQAFDESDDVVLVVKAPAAADADVRTAIERVRATSPDRDDPQRPRVEVLAEDLTDEEMMRLQGSVDALVSCERGDGWNIPAMDSMTLGVPVVVPEHGGSMSFVEPSDSYPVPTSDLAVDCDSMLARPHRLYSGQYWPYVDPAAFASVLRRVHDDPRGRERRGREAAARIRGRFAEASCAGAIVELAASNDPIDLRSNRPAVVRVRASADAWEQADGAERRRLNEALQRSLRRRSVDVADPGRIALARAGTGAILRGELGPGLLGAARVRGDAARAVVEGGRAVRRAAREARRLADLPELGELAGYLAAQESGRPAADDPQRTEDRRRRLENRFGPVRTPDADLQRLATLRDRHLGERVVILGNGPSLLAHDLSKLAGEHTFGVNKIYLLFDRIDWRPSYYTLLDWKMGAAVRDDVHRLEGTVKFFPERFRGVLPEDADTYWYWARAVGTHVDDQFEPNIVHGIPSRATVLVTAIQQAFFLGFREIVLIGVDASYTITPTVRQEGSDHFGTGTRLHLTSTVDDDPNHFSPAYFGAGARWHDPNVPDMHRMFRLMRKGVERHGGRLLNATAGGQLEVLERVDYDSVFA